MNAEEYEIMFNVEDRHWWYISLRAMVRLIWQEHICQERPRVLDVGCGTGATLATLSASAQCTGVDLAPQAIRFCRRRGLVSSFVASAVELPFGPDTFDAALSLDVLCHRSIRDWHAPLLEIRRVLKPGGILILNLPAYQWLTSSHDAAVHTVRRFTRRQVVEALRVCGLEPVQATYWNSLMFPMIALTRLWRKLHPRPSSDLLGASDGILNTLLKGILASERLLARLAALPFGLSVIAAARKK